MRLCFIPDSGLAKVWAMNSPKVTEAQLDYIRNVLGLDALVTPRAESIFVDQVAATDQAAQHVDQQPDQHIEQSLSEVRAQGPKNAKLVVVSGTREDVFPFEGEEGVLADKMIQAMKLNLNEVRRLEWCKGDAPEEVLKEVEAAPLVLVFGESAFSLLTRGKIARAGEWTSVSSARVLVTYDPKLLMQEPERKKITWAHLQTMMREMR